MIKRTTTRAVTAAALLYAARRFYRNWGTTKEECRMSLPGDKLVDPPAIQTTEGVWIDAPASAVWPWLVQMGQDRGGLYSYETLENLFGLRYHNADRIHPEWQRLARGDLVRLAPKGWMGIRGGIASVRCRHRRASNHRAARGAVRSRVGRGLVVAPHPSLGRPLPTADPIANASAPRRRHARAGAHRSCQSVGDSRNVAGYQAQSAEPIAGDDTRRRREC